MIPPPHFNGNKRSPFSVWVERGGPWVWAQNFLALAEIALAPVFYGQWQNRAAVIAGALLFGMGAAIGLAGVRALGRNRTPYPKPHEDAYLVENGIYALVRHPLYSSVISLSLGWTLMWRSWPALVAALALVLLLDAKARLEERWLREKLPEYDAYARRVKRFVPGVY